MRLILGILLLIVLIALIFFVVKLLADRKNRSAPKWLKASFLLPFLPFVLLFMPTLSKEKEAQKQTESEAKPDTGTQTDTDTQEASQDSSKPLMSFFEYIGIFLIALLEVFLIWSFNNWLSQPWQGADSDFSYDKTLIEAPSEETRQSANAFLAAFFDPETKGESISMPPFRESRVREHCLSLCGYSGICDQMKLMACMDDYKQSYEAVFRYLKRYGAYPWVKPLVRSLAQKNDREGVLDYGKLSQQLKKSQESFERLKTQYDSHKAAPVLLATALEGPMKKTGVPDFIESEKIYKQTLRFYR